MRHLKWDDARIIMHRVTLDLVGRKGHHNAGYVEVVCKGADMHDLAPCGQSCKVCASGHTPRCPDCGASV